MLSLKFLLLSSASVLSVSVLSLNARNSYESVCGMFVFYSLPIFSDGCVII